ncbi:MAG: hypothetical protein ACHRHE_17395 [Tepidisphaerales bacterium]
MVTYYEYKATKNIRHIVLGGQERQQEEEVEEEGRTGDGRKEAQKPFCGF